MNVTDPQGASLRPKPLSMIFRFLKRRAPGRTDRRPTKRAAERICVAHETILIVRKGRAVYPAFVSDITNHGFMARADTDIRERDLIEINLPIAGWVVAQVRWTGTDDGQLGCKFLEPMDPELFEKCLAELVPSRHWG